MKKIITILILLINLNNFSQNMESYWTETYKKTMEGFWGKVESASGPGSTIQQTTFIRSEIEKLIKDLKITSILDAPCGDFNWMRYVDMDSCEYIGSDVVQPLINNNNNLYKNESRRFLHLDVTKDILPNCELIICRDLLVHFSTEDVYRALKNFKLCGAKYLLTTTFIGKQRQFNHEIETGGWRPINLQIFPFNFHEPLLIINENCTEQDGNYSDKSLALWKLEDIYI